MSKVATGLAASVIASIVGFGVYVDQTVQFPEASVNANHKITEAIEYKTGEKVDADFTLSSESPRTVFPLLPSGSSLKLYTKTEEGRIVNIATDSEGTIGLVEVKTTAGKDSFEKAVSHYQAHFGDQMNSTSFGGKPIYSVNHEFSVANALSYASPKEYYTSMLNELKKGDSFGYQNFMLNYIDKQGAYNINVYDSRVLKHQTWEIVKQGWIERHQPLVDKAEEHMSQLEAMPEVIQKLTDNTLTLKLLFFFDRGVRV
ncbi:hypothetical protein [Neptuniibacter sp. QD37_11]|uniref:hypothetical protein n=1 Tax=Neptuniibacter sp. QD37_11 TaxID=3398209 RepID=UPI0039F4AEDC